MNLTCRQLRIIGLTLLSAAIAPNLRAQGTAFTYQGSLKNGGSPATGLYDLTFTLFDTNSAGNVIAGPLTNSATPVTNGLFTVTLDFGSAPFNGNARWLEIGVRTNGGTSFSSLNPRQELTPTPYAIYANTASTLSGALPSTALGGTYSNSVTFNNGANSFDGTFSGQFFGSTFIGGNFVGNFVGSGSSLSDVWHTGGNFGTVPLLNFLGTTDNQPLIFKVYGVEAMRFEPTSDTPNVVGGYSGNYVQPGLPGVTIGGGGSPFNNQPNIVTNNGNYATIAGGYHNLVSGYGGAILGGSVQVVGGNFGVVGGGQFNTEQGGYSFIGSGIYNQITTNGYTSFLGAGYANILDGPWSVIAGGYYNTNSGGINFIGCGDYNICTTNASYSFIGGGVWNNIDSYVGTIGGGYLNAIQPGAGYSVIGGGDANSIQANAGYSFIGGGYNNSVRTNADHAVIGGGWQNVIQASAWESVISGGALNSIAPLAQWAVVGGGDVNTNGSSFSVIGGGINNVIQTNASNSFIGGGGYNGIGTNSGSAVIAGGYVNSIGPNANRTTVSGGNGNAIQDSSTGGTIGGGIANVIGTNSSQATISGGNGNAIQNGSGGSTIGGGIGDVIGTNSTQATISGGGGNAIQNGSGGSAIGGGIANVIGTNSIVATIAGGNYNYVGNFSAQSAIGGGLYNTNVGFASTTPGGYLNQASSAYAFAAGQRAKARHTGAFVWADSQNLDFTSTAPNQFNVRANGGVVFNTGGAGVTVDGQSVFAGSVPAGGLVGTYSNSVNFNNGSDSFNGSFNGTFSGSALGSFSGDGSALNNLNASHVSSGTLPVAQLPPQAVVNGQSGVTLTGTFIGDGSSLTNVNALYLNGLTSSRFWQLGGNAGTSPGTDFIGTTDGANLMLKAGFVGVGRSSPITVNEVFGVNANAGAGTFAGMYINTTNAFALPFYGYSLAGAGVVYHYVDGSDTNKWKLVTGGGVRITVMQNGNVGIGTTTPDAPLSVSGVADKTGGGSWAVFSDIRLKKNIEPLRGALNRLLELRPVTFEYKDPQSIHEAPGVQIGMIAQEVEKVFPDWVDTAHNGMKRLSIHGFEALTVQALRELRAEKDAKIAELEAANDRMRGDLTAQKETTARLEARLAALEKAFARTVDPSAGGLAANGNPFEAKR
jgi:hypothetical protein